MQTPIYSASSDVLVQPRGQDGLFENQVVNLNERAIQTEIQVIEGQAVRERVQDDLGLAEPPPPANASAVGETDVISITVRDTNAANARLSPNAYAAAYIDVRREQAVDELLAASAEVQIAIDDLQAQIDALDRRRPSPHRRSSPSSSNFNTTLDQLRVDAALRTGGAAIIKSAEVPTSPVEPTPARTAMLAAVVGLLIGLGAAFLLDYLDDKVRSEDDLDAARRPAGARRRADRPAARQPADRHQRAGTRLPSRPTAGCAPTCSSSGSTEPISVIQLTSSMAGEGKTTTSANLAVVLAQAGHRVALVDADLRRPRLHEVFGIPQIPGFTDLLLGAEPEGRRQPRRRRRRQPAQRVHVGRRAVEPQRDAQRPAHPSACSTRWARTTTTSSSTRPRSCPCPTRSRSPAPSTA